jgi:O-acetyl-ADP-ribose deacetylase (regulator of RNase III)
MSDRAGPEIVESTGSIFDSACTALVSPVDAATGAQGKGLALLFKRRWPERCEQYRRACRTGAVSAGHVTASTGRPLILFAATKRHWKEPSRITYVRECLDSIVYAVWAHRAESIAIPALGCGLGSLDWSDVRPLMLDTAKRMQCERVVIYGPK